MTDERFVTFILGPSLIICMSRIFFSSNTGTHFQNQKVLLLITSTLDSQFWNHAKSYLAQIQSKTVDCMDWKYSECVEEHTHTFEFDFLDFSADADADDMVMMPMLMIWQ